MKKYIAIAIAILFCGCNDTSTYVPDGTPKLQSEMDLQSKIQSALNDLFSSRLDSLEKRVTDLETRLTTVEANIASMTEQITSLFDSVTLLDQADIDIRAQIERTATDLQAADAETREILCAKFNFLSRKLAKEIRSRKLADNDLQDQIDSLNDGFDQFAASQQVIDEFLAFGLYLAGDKISMLETKLKHLSKQVHDNYDEVQAEVAGIQGQISGIQTNIANIGTQLDDVKDKLVSVVHPCGDENEALLQTQDGLVGVFSIGSTQELAFNDSDTIPEHATCDKVINIPGLGIHDACVSTVLVPAATVYQQTTVSYFSLDQVKLASLPDGTYDASTGWSCTFQVASGQVVSGN